MTLKINHITKSAFKDKVLDMIVRTKMSEEFTRGRSTVERLAQSVLRQTSHHALRWDDHLVKSQEGLETTVGLKAEMVGAPGSVAWFYMNGECGGYGIEHS
ncbi:hypothetical protein M9H77_30879 [Catharanthus roseus]|uniref:Uncharacterized protein n=1 Tax=Catharanthus roseus TaxID=4058 RepID=A0ACB9ZZS9_CATRO|nr:hypothetical protein M9H77_30879 [Catharanthus roseus]